LSITFAVEMDHQIMKVAEETKRIVNGNIRFAFGWRLWMEVVGGSTIKIDI